MTSVLSKKQALVQLLTEVGGHHHPSSPNHPLHHLSPHSTTWETRELEDEFSFAWTFANMLEDNYLLWTERDKLCYTHTYQKFISYKHANNAPDQFYVFPWNRDEEMEESYQHGGSIDSFATVAGQHIGKSPSSNAFNTANNTINNTEFRGDESINAHKRKYQHHNPYSFEDREFNTHKAPRLMNLPSPRSFMSLPEDRDTLSTPYFQSRFPPNNYSYAPGSNSENHVDNDYLSESESSSASSSFSPPSAAFQFEETFSRHGGNSYSHYQYDLIVQPEPTFGNYHHMRQYSQNSNNNGSHNHGNSNNNNEFVRIKSEPQQPLSPQPQQNQPFSGKDDNNMDTSTSPTMHRRNGQQQQQQGQQQEQQKSNLPTSPVSPSSDDKSGDEKVKPESGKKAKKIQGSSGGDSNCGNGGDNISGNSSDEEKPWQCPIPLCKSGYQRKGDLKYHIIRKHHSVAHFYPHLIQSRSSKANKNFVCPIATCQSGYMRYSDLKSHFVQKHPDKLEEHPELCPSDRLTCPVGNCGQMFTRHGNLIKHLKQEHPDEAPKIIKEIDNGGSVGKLSRSNSKEDNKKEPLVIAEDK